MSGVEVLHVETVATGEAEDPSVAAWPGFVDVSHVAPDPLK